MREHTKMYFCPACVCFNRFHEHWRFVLQRLVFLAAFVVYLETETLVTREAVAEILGSRLTLAALNLVEVLEVVVVCYW